MTKFDQIWQKLCFLRSKFWWFLVFSSKVLSFLCKNWQNFGFNVKMWQKKNGFFKGKTIRDFAFKVKVLITWGFRTKVSSFWKIDKILVFQIKIVQFLCEKLSNYLVSRSKLVKIIELGQNVSKYWVFRSKLVDVWMRLTIGDV